MLSIFLLWSFVVKLGWHIHMLRVVNKNKNLPVTENAKGILHYSPGPG